jgi:hypothetical protein
MIRWHSARVNLPNIGQLFVVFPFLDVILFGMSRKIAYSRCFDISLQDRDGSVTSHVCASEMRAYYALRGGKCLFKSVNCDVLARMGTTLLNELMGTTGRGAKGRMFGK